MRTIIHALIVTLVVSGYLSPVQAAGRHSFAKAAASKSYPEPKIRAMRDCKALLAQTPYEYSIISSVEIPADGKVPAHCRITGQVLPEVLFRVNLPRRWNGRLYMHGNGGFAGVSPDAPQFMHAANRGLEYGFATAYTDTGHSDQTHPLATFAYDNRQREVDYGYRAVHVTVLTAKELIRQFYDRAPEKSYFDGCSTGGRQALISAQRFPNDFDGILSGAPVLDLSGTQMSYVHQLRQLDRAKFTPAHVHSLGEAVYAQCDEGDGIRDNIIGDPRQCDFDPARHLTRCQDPTEGTCFTTTQIDALGRIFNDMVVGGEVYFPRMPWGAEITGNNWMGGDENQTGWQMWFMPPRPNAGTITEAFATSFFQYLAFDTDDPYLTLDKIDIEKDIKRMGAVEALLNAEDPDLSAFRERGGKLIMYHGWADLGVNPYLSVNYYESVAKAMDPGTENFTRLYMLPGVFHCSGGSGAYDFDGFTALVDWVEGGKPPRDLRAAHLESDGIKFTRPVCAYPETPHYKGRGDRNDAGSFECK